MQPFVPKWYKRRVVKKQWSRVKSVTYQWARRQLDRHDCYWPEPEEPNPDDLVWTDIGWQKKEWINETD